MLKITQALMVMGLFGITACGDIGLSAGPAGTGTTAGTTTAGTTTSGTTTSTTSGTTTSTTSGSTTSTTSGTTSGTTTGTSTCTSTSETYANFGMAFIAAHCISCHGAGASPDLSTLANITAQQSTVASQIVMTGANGGMPPAGSPVLSDSDKANVAAWLACNPLP